MPDAKRDMLYDELERRLSNANLVPVVEQPSGSREQPSSGRSEQPSTDSNSKPKRNKSKERIEKKNKSKGRIECKERPDNTE